MRLRLPSHLPFVAIALAVILGAAAVVVLASHTPTGTLHPSNEGLRQAAGHARIAPAPPLEPTESQLIAAGDYATCAATRRGLVACWGDNSHGQLGDGSRTSKDMPSPLADLGRVAALSAGGSHACVALSNGRVLCWGANAHGELGNGTTADARRPLPVAGITAAVDVAAGVAHSCAVERSGTVLCWGAGASGQLGSGKTRDSIQPTTVVSDRARSIAAGLAHTCALLRDHTVACWGSNSNGQLGDGTTRDSAVPVAVKDLAAPASAVAAGDAHTCALLGTGEVECWGWNIEGQIGSGSPSDALTPVPVVGIEHAVAIAAGGSHTCAVLRSGALTCWGANVRGELGNGTTTNSNVPVAVSGLTSGVTAVAAGFSHTCALLAGGSVTCWGSDGEGQLGNGTTTGSTEPANVLRLGLARDGSGSLTTGASVLPSGSKGHTISFAFTAAPGGMHDGAVAITVPLGWSTPASARALPGYTTSTAGRIRVLGRTINVDDLTMNAGESFTVTYGSQVGGGPGAVAGSPGTQVWRGREQSSANGALSPLHGSPAISVLSGDGSGTVGADARLYARGRPGGLTFTYTAARGGLADGMLAFQPPADWPLSSKLATTTRGNVLIAGGRLLITHLTLHGGESVRVTYSGIPATSAKSGAWSVLEQSSPDGTLQPLAKAPDIALVAADGSGSFEATTPTVVNGSPGNTITFTYHPQSGVVIGGIVTLTVPPGWTPPTTQRGTDGYVQVSRGKATVAGRLIRVAVGDLRTGPGLTITYENGKAPSGSVGTQTWVAKERSTPKGQLRPLGSSPAITVLAPDGAGTLGRASGPTTPASTGNTVVFTFGAGTGGMAGGTVVLTVPAGWSAPSSRGADPGYVTASTGRVSVSGRKITVSDVTLESGQTITIVYGGRAGGGPGARAPAGNVGPSAWPAAESSSSGGTLKPLR